MIDLLEELVEKQDYKTAIKLAQQLLRQPGNSAADLARLNRCLCRSWIGTGDNLAAIPAGELARKLARDLGLWDLHGQVCNELSSAYLYSRQYDSAMGCCYEFLQEKHHYSQARHREGWIYVHLGRAYLGKQQWKEGALWFDRAVTFHRRRNEHNWALWARTGLIECCQKYDPGRVGGLLRDNHTDLRAHNGDKDMRAVHLLSVARHAFHRGKYQRALALAQPAVKLPQWHIKLIVEAYFIMSKSAELSGDTAAALIYALAGRSVALAQGRYDLGFEAVELIYDLVRAGGSELVAEVDREYRAAGIDIAPLVGDTILTERKDVE